MSFAITDEDREEYDNEHEGFHVSIPLGHALGLVDRRKHTNVIAWKGATLFGPSVSVQRAFHMLLIRAVWKNHTLYDPDYS